MPSEATTRERLEALEAAAVLDGGPPCAAGARLRMLLDAEGACKYG